MQSEHRKVRYEGTLNPIVLSQNDKRFLAKLHKGKSQGELQWILNSHNLFYFKLKAEGFINTNRQYFPSQEMIDGFYKLVSSYCLWCSKRRDGGKKIGFLVLFAGILAYLNGNGTHSKFMQLFQINSSTFYKCLLVIKRLGGVS